MRTGLVGTGYWAQTVHAPSLAQVEGVDLAGVWGRNETERERLAERFGVRAYATFDDLLSDVDAVDFAIVPSAQAPLALTAADAGKNLLLEKPAALDAAEAAAIADAVDTRGARATVFLTRLFDDRRLRALLAQRARSWPSAHVEWISAALSEGSPYAGSAWRHGTGVLWDLLPHVFSQLGILLGPVEAFRVDAAEAGGIVELSFRHGSGAESSVRMTANARPEEKVEWLEVWDDTERLRLPDPPIDFVAAHGAAVGTLLGAERADPAVLTATTVRAAVATTELIQAIERTIAAGGVAGGWIRTQESNDAGR